MISDLSGSFPENDPCAMESWELLFDCHNNFMVIL